MLDVDRVVLAAINHPILLTAAYYNDSWLWGCARLYLEDRDLSIPRNTANLRFLAWCIFIKTRATWATDNKLSLNHYNCPLVATKDNFLCLLANFDKCVHSKRRSIFHFLAWIRTNKCISSKCWCFYYRTIDVVDFFEKQAGLPAS